jgi:hypothetical protein
MARSIAVPVDDWKTESDLNTMIEAERIEKDPKRLAKVQALAKRKMIETAAIAAESKDKS